MDEIRKEESAARDQAEAPTAQGESRDAATPREGDQQVTKLRVKTRIRAGGSKC